MRNINRLVIFWFLVLTLLVACGGSGGGDSSQYNGSIEEDVTIQGDVSRIIYPISVYLPEGYGKDPDQTYPVLYLLDAEWWFLPAVGLVDDKNKSLIVVGIGNTDGQEQGRRAIDYRMPGATAYYSFLVTQVIPYIDATYMTNTAERTLSGHSYGGLFTGLALLLEDPNNRYFNKYLSQDGSFWHQKNVTKELEEQLYSLDTSLSVTLFLSGATGMDGNAGAVNWFYTIINNRGYSDLDMDYMTFDASHAGEYPLSMGNALDIFYPD